MCIQDIRIAKRLTYKPFSGTAAGANVINSILGQNSQRWAIAFCATQTTTSFRFGTSDGITVVPLCVLTSTFSWVLLRFLDFGPLLFSAMYAATSGANTNYAGYELLMQDDPEITVNERY